MAAPATTNGPAARGSRITSPIRRAGRTRSRAIRSDAPGCELTGVPVPRRGAALENGSIVTALPAASASMAGVAPVETQH